MTEYQSSGDELVEKLRRGYDLTEGIPPTAHDRSSVRRVEHAGHRLEIHTHYRILIDGQEFPDPIHVADDGTVHYHGIPQYSAPSAVDLVKVIAERLDEGEPPPLIGEPQPRHDHHDHHGQGH
jgi:hypothetical protein